VGRSEEGSIVFPRRLDHLGEQEPARQIGRVKAAFQVGWQAVHLPAPGARVGHGLAAAPDQESGYPQLGGTQIGKTGEVAVKAGRLFVFSLRLQMLGNGHGAGDEQVGVLQQHHQVVALQGFGLAAGADRGHRLPAPLDGLADAVLVVLGKPVPEGGALPVPAGQRCPGFAVSRPFRRKKRQGWGKAFYRGFRLLVAA